MKQSCGNWKTISVNLLWQSLKIFKMFEQNFSLVFNFAFKFFFFLSMFVTAISKSEADNGGNNLFFRKQKFHYYICKRGQMICSTRTHHWPLLLKPIWRLLMIFIWGLSQKKIYFYLRLTNDWWGMKVSFIPLHRPKAINLGILKPKNRLRQSFQTAQFWSLDSTTQSWSPTDLRPNNYKHKLNINPYFVLDIL